jgi:site-specific recombinase XerD
MRHLMCSNLVEKGGTYEEAATVAGHKDVNTTKKWYITNHNAKG